jgi:Tfp pilus assembly protein PilN
MKDINLMMEEKSVQNEESKPAKAVGRVKAVTILILVAAFVVVTLVVPKVYTNGLNLRLSYIQNQVNSQKYTEVKNINRQLASTDQALNSKKEIMASIDSIGYPVNDILNAAENNIPEGCTVNSLEYDTDSLKLAVKGQNIANIADFLLNMDRLDFLQLSDSSKNIRLNKNGEYSFSFDISGKGDK